MTAIGAPPEFNPKGASVFRVEHFQLRSTGQRQRRRDAQKKYENRHNITYQRP